VRPGEIRPSFDERDEERDWVSEPRAIDIERIPMSLCRNWRQYCL
jgi:hypothetical protein